MGLSVARKEYRIGNIKLSELYHEQGIFDFKTDPCIRNSFNYNYYGNALQESTPEDVIKVCEQLIEERKK